MSVLRKYIDSILYEAERDFKQLRDLNAKSLKKQTPQKSDENPRDYNQRLAKKAETGPIFSEPTLSSVRALQDDVFSRTNRKTFVKWLGTSIEKGELPDPIPIEQIRSVRDWFDAEKPKTDSLSWTEATKETRKWHEAFKKPGAQLGDYETKDVVFDFKNGFTIVRVPAEDLKHEGDMMQHCVGGRCGAVTSGDVEIYSLRDKNNKPHVTIEISHRNGPRRISEIKGKQNSAPIQKYGRMIRKWLENEGFDLINADCGDVVSILEDDEIIQGFDAGKVETYDLPLRIPILKHVLETRGIQELNEIIGSKAINHDEQLDDDVASFLLENGDDDSFYILGRMAKNDKQVKALSLKGIGAWRGLAGNYGLRPKMIPKLMSVLKKTGDAKIADELIFYSTYQGHLDLLPHIFHRIKIKNDSDKGRIQGHLNYMPSLMNDLKEKGSPNAKKNIQALANIMIKTNTLVDFNAWYIRKSSDEMKRLFKSINERIQEKNA